MQARLQAVRYRIMAYLVLPVVTIFLLVMSGTANKTADVTAAPSTITPNTTMAAIVLSCNDIFIANTPLNIPVVVCFSICMLLGVLLVFLGYRCFKCSMFLMGFLYAVVITYVISSDHSELTTWGLVGVALAVGVFCGLLTMFVTHCGLFLCGVSVGLDIALTGLVVTTFFYDINSHWITLGILVGLSLIFALLALKWQKVFTVLATATVGGVLFTVGADYFIEEFVLMRYMWESMSAQIEQELCLHSWFVLGIWPMLFILGCLVQFLKTGRDVYHRKRKSDMTLEAGDRAMKRYRSLNRSADVVTKPYHLQPRRESDVDGPVDI